ncbi:MAG: CoA transferase [Acetobacteraceae bacterium]|nr:CoA transferase [Acetobacteraceae bacterium]
MSDLAAGAVAAAALAAAEWAGLPADTVMVDRRLASFWFGWSFLPLGWTAPPDRDPLSGDYRAADGWIRLHCNAPHHRAAALAVLGTPPERDAVAGAVRRHTADALEASVVAAGGCAAAMRSMQTWSQHPQGIAVREEPLVWLARTGSGPAPARPDPVRPLAGVRVLDLTRVFAGPACTRALAGLGADVLRIDPPNWQEPGNEPEMTLGKRCARLDARDPNARALLQSLLQQADIFVHGYRPGALAGLGLGEAERDRLRPGLVDILLDAYGWTGPWAGRRGFDSLVQMSSGIAAEGMRQTGADRPVPLPVQALDHAAGWIMAAAALRGLAERAAGASWRARTSLARVAALLAPSLRRGERGGALGRPAPADYADAVETTVWGPLRRLRSPFQIAGAGLQWDLPAGRLGSAPARWRD